MKRFLLRLLPFALLIIAVAAVRYKISYDARYNFYNVPAQPIQHALVIVGDSKTLFGVSDSLLPPGPFYNLSSWGSRPLNTAEAIGKFELKNNIILLSVSSRIFLQNDTVSVGNYNSISTVFDFNLYTKWRDQMKQSSLGPWEFNIRPSGSLTFKNLTRSYAEYSATKDTTFYGNFLHAPDRDVYVNIKLKHFAELYRHLSAQNKVILIDLPERSAYSEMAFGFEKNLHKEIEAITGDTVIDFGVYPDDCFYDSHHMNKRGADRWTKEMATVLAK